MNNFLRHISLWIVLLIIVVLALSIFQMQETKRPMGEPDFITQLNAGNIESVTLKEVGATWST